MLTPVILFAASSVGIIGCSSTAEPNQRLADRVDLSRFLGKWYVQGCTPTFLDKGAVNATETYQLDDNGKIKTTYAFRKGQPTGPAKAYYPVGWVHDKETNAEWRMRFFGLFTSPYYILYVDDQYERTVVGHPNKRLAWIMSREPNLSQSAYDRLLQELVDRDYDLSDFKRMQQTWE